MGRLLLIDDHVLVREGLRILLEAAGHEVVGEAAAPTEGLAALRRLAPDLVLLDLGLGARSGFELLDELRRRRTSTPVVVLSMSNRPRDVAEAMRHGAAAYVLKGSPSADLLRAIDAALQGHTHLGPTEADLAMRGLTENGPESAALSPRERQVLVMVARGQSSAEIGRSLHLSPKTIDTYRSRAMAKLGLGDVPALVRWAIREGLIDVDDG